MLFTVGAWALCIGVIKFDCLVHPLDYIEGSKYVYFLPEAVKLIVEAECDRLPALKNDIILQILGCVVDVISDVASVSSTGRARRID